IDPILVLSDSSGRELAASDDYFRADPLLCYRVEKDGDYLIQVRDVRYMGDARWIYCLTATKRPFITALYPMAVKPSQTVELHPVGFELAGMHTTHLNVPLDWSCGPHAIQLEAPAGLSNPVPILVSDLDESAETEDNDDFAHANAWAIPGGISGRMD